MHEEVIDVLWILTRSFEWLSRESGKAFLIHEYSKGINSVYQGVDSQIELKSIYKVWIVQISLGNILVPILELNILKLPHQKDAATLTQVHWLNNKDLVPSFLSLQTSPSVLG